jgi:deoxyguanosine kinase
LILDLRVDTEIAMRRIAMRDRTYERNMDQAYIASLNEAYEVWYSRPPQSPVLTLDTNSLDYVSRPEHLAYVANRIRDALGIPPYQPELPLKGGSPG